MTVFLLAAAGSVNIRGISGKAKFMKALKNLSNGRSITTLINSRHTYKKGRTLYCSFIVHSLSITQYQTNQSRDSSCSGCYGRDYPSSNTLCLVPISRLYAVHLGTKVLQTINGELLITCYKYTYQIIHEL